jgi:hypothetical protein
VPTQPAINVGNHARDREPPDSPQPVWLRQDSTGRRWVTFALSSSGGFLRSRHDSRDGLAGLPVEHAHGEAHEQVLAQGQHRRRDPPFLQAVVRSVTLAAGGISLKV